MKCMQVGTIRKLPTGEALILRVAFKIVDVGTILNKEYLTTFCENYYSLHSLLIEPHQGRYKVKVQYYATLTPVENKKNL